MADEAGVERRLAAILAADVVGYSRLMEVDEAGTHARLKALRKEFIEPRVAEHHGRIVKLTGDGALVEFPSVVEAVLCAVDVQRIVAERNADVPPDQRIEFRIGVNLGDVIIEDDDLYGDGVNVAARLQTLAEPGGIYVSRTVYNHVKNKVGLTFEPMGEHKVKNIAEPITVFRVKPGPASASQDGTQRNARRSSGADLAIAAAVAVLLAARAAGTWYALWRPACRAAGVGRFRGCSQAGVAVARQTFGRGAAVREPLRRSKAGAPRRRPDRRRDYRPVALSRAVRDRTQLHRGLQRQAGRRAPGRARPRRPIRPRRQPADRWRSGAHHGAIDRRHHRQSRVVGALRSPAR